MAAGAKPGITEADVREIARLTDLSKSFAIYKRSDGSRTYRDIPPFAPIDDRVRVRRRLWARPKSLKRGRKGFIAWDGAGISTEIEGPVTGVGIHFRVNWETVEWVMTYARIAEVAAFGKVFRLIIHQSRIEN